MTTRHAACNCGQLHLTIEGESVRISTCHCLACQRRTGAVFSNQASFRREQVTFTGKATTWNRTAESASVVTFNFCPTCGSTGLLGERKFSWTRHCCHRKLRRPEFPGADRLGVGGVTPPLGLVAARYSAQRTAKQGCITGSAV
jgi:hypothetical protein